MEKLTREAYLALEHEDRAAYSLGLLSNVVTSTGDVHLEGLGALKEVARWEIYVQLVEPCVNNGGKITSDVLKTIEDMPADVLRGAVLTLIGLVMDDVADTGYASAAAGSPYVI